MKLLFLSVFIVVTSFTFYTGFNFSKVDNFNDLNLVNRFSHSIKNVQHLTLNEDAENLPTIDGKMNIMLMGVDERSGDVGRSDTLMLLSLNANRESASLLSIPRDTRVKIKGHNYDKINAAYAYGGENLSQSTLESFLGINIDHYVIVNTSSFVDLIDALGGIDISVEKRMKYEDPWDDGGGLVIDLKPGIQHMDGKTAITYVRYRDAEGDAGRVRRQQKFMRACLNKLSSPTMIVRLPEIITKINSAVHTDLSITELIAVASTLINADKQKDGLKTGIVPGQWLYINGVAYLIPNIERLGQVITDNLDIGNDNTSKYFEKMAYDYSDSVPFDYNKDYYDYDENVNKRRDRKLIEQLNEKHFLIKENEV
ncbi:MAG: LCP family protein [Selenomonadaceae bacterium]|nr:LCP family protein [Selenomonadaceae bacterium]